MSMPVPAGDAALNPDVPAQPADREGALCSLWILFTLTRRIPSVGSIFTGNWVPWSAARCGPYRHLRLQCWPMQTEQRRSKKKRFLRSYIVKHYDGRWDCDHIA
jgi:hypothetical protein